MSLKCTLLGADGADPFPCFSNIWSIYAKKGLRTVFLSIGNV